MPDARPDPDSLLARVQADEARAARGSLRIFFGYAAGVGKTYAMLQSARQAKTEGRDVVAGYVEPHDRPETQALLEGLETLPVRAVEHRGVRLREFDVDAALARHPDLVLLDELAHTNAPGSRHEKRFRDAEELLAAGIDVWTTLNVQHIESLNDVVGQITGVVVRETVPDRVFDLADDIELVDVTPEELLDRLEAGKIYLPEQARRAIGSFFQKGHLLALRELSLRQAARRIHSDVESARREKDVAAPWATNDRLLVCVGPSPTTARVIRTAKRMAAALDAPWLAVSVDVAGDDPAGPARRQIARHFRLAERLGAETITLPGRDVADTVLDFARSRNVTQILVGKTLQPRWRRLLAGTVVDDLLDRSGGIDVYVIQGGAEERETEVLRRPRPRSRGAPHLAAGALIAATAAVVAVARRLRIADSEANAVMLFLAAVAWTAFRYGRGPAVLASVLAVLVFDFLFVPPFFTFAVADAQYLVTFVVMLAMGLVVAGLTSRLRAQVEAARRRERRTTSLYELGRQLTSLSGDVALVGAAAGRIAEMLSAEVAVYLGQPAGPPRAVHGGGTTIAAHPRSAAVAQWAVEHERIAGSGTDTLPEAPALFVPLIGTRGAVGALAVRSSDSDHLLEPEQRRLLEACANQLAFALERDRLTVEAAESRISAETEQVRSSILSGVSHDLKTPLAAIAAAGGTLLENPALDEESRRRLLETVAEESLRLNRLLDNILQMTRLDAGAVVADRQWHVLEEIVGSALHRLRGELQDRIVEVRLPPDLPLVFVDDLLLEQVFVNLLENAARYTPAGTRISVEAAVEAGTLRIAVADEGPGLPPGTEERVFDRFLRLAPVADGGRGSGLGLAICRGIARAHDGTITAANRSGGGAEFVLRLPLPEPPPRVATE